jgi:hypothetical protein
MDYKKHDNYQRYEQQNKALKREQKSNPILSVKWIDRWDVFHRLQALGIECQCCTNKPLLVDLHSPTTVAQVWSVARQFSTPRHELIDWLDNCWEVQYDYQKR